MMSITQENTAELTTKHPPSLRIALVTETFPPEVNGVAMTMGRIVEGLLQRSHEVQIVRPRQSSADSPNKREGLNEVLVKGIPIPFYKDLRFGLPSESRLIKLWQKHRPDVVHVVTEGPLGRSAVNAARKLNLPVTSSFHTNFHNYSSHYGIGLLKASIDAYLRMLHNRTMATLVPTNAMVQELQERGYKNVSLFSRGVAIDLFKPERRSTALRKSWGANDRDVVVLYVGRLAKEKNVGLVLTAFSSIQSRLPTAKLVFVGDGPLHKSLQDACPKAIFAGVRTGEELATYYASGDLFLFPSLTETFGNVVPEALASGLAVVAYDYAAAANLITHEHNGMVVALGEEMQFARTALVLATNNPKLLAIRQQAAPSVAHLDWGSVCDRFANTLSSVVESRGNYSRPRSLARTGPLIQPST
jgi:glycosyltransferase involved in cell wall biosynthesis